MVAARFGLRLRAAIAARGWLSREAAKGPREQAETGAEWGGQAECEEQGSTEMAEPSTNGGATGWPSGGLVVGRPAEG